MCYICSCIVYAIDFVQRILTCCLLYLLTYAVCIGFTLAVVAGIAYGYNYSLAEFLAFTRSDVTVYMRRGQFYDKPDLGLGWRRSRGGEESVFAANQSIDNEEPGSQSQPLAESWQQSQDTRRYAEKLTKYSPEKRVENFIAPQNSIQAKSQVISIFPSPLLATVSWQSGSSEIIMRSFRPLQDNPSDVTKSPDDLFLTPDMPVKALGFHGGKNIPESLAHSETHQRSVVPMRVWTTAARHVPEYATEEIDEESIVYKPV